MHDIERWKTMALSLWTGAPHGSRVECDSVTNPALDVIVFALELGL